MGMSLMTDTPLRDRMRNNKGIFMHPKTTIILFGLSILALTACGGGGSGGGGSTPPASTPPSLPAGTVVFTDTYMNNANGPPCNSSFAMTGAEPSMAGKYPIFVYVVGTGESPTSRSALAAIYGMASRGYIAATVAYPNGTFGNCATLSGRSQCIFDSASADSAVSHMCARPNADCTKGIVGGGFSQGSVLATLAKNFDTRIRAAWALGAHVQYSTVDLNACMANGNHTIANAALRVVNGEADLFPPPGNATAAANRTSSQNVTGFVCGASDFSCLQPNGSGWYVVQNSQDQDGSADHCYMRTGGGCAMDVLDSGWENGTDPWELKANVDWVIGVTRH